MRDQAAEVRDWAPRASLVGCQISLQQSCVLALVLLATSCQELETSPDVGVVIGDQECVVSHRPTTSDYSTSHEVRRVVVDGDTAYLAASGALVTVDVSDPAAPVVLTTLPAAVNDIDVVGSTAVLVLSGNSDLGDFSVLDVTDPAAPTVLCSLEHPQMEPWAFYAVAVSGVHAYVADFFGGFKVIDISDPTAPFVVTSIEEPLDNGKEVVVAGDRLYVLDWNGVHVFDIAEPAAPKFLSTVFHVSSGSIALEGTLLYLGSGGSFHVIDLQSDNKVLGQVDVENGGISGVALDDQGFAYVTTRHGTNSRRNQAGWLNLIDISDPRHPVVLNELDLVFGLDIAIQADTAYVANGKQGLTIFDLSCLREEEG